MTTRTRVLVVDDDADAREMLSAVLAQAGYDVDAAADGFAALAHVSRYRPDLVLTDLRMPGMTGVDLLQRIRRVHGDVPVIIATGLETWDLCTAAEAYGAVTCLIKPIDVEDLVWNIEMALAVRQNVTRGSAAI
ncbi:MAG TPA: response regulator [Polyangia bacterium]|jgi:DNA-binding NtrC family response regulator